MLNFDKQWLYNIGLYVGVGTTVCCVSVIRDIVINIYITIVRVWYSNLLMILSSLGNKIQFSGERAIYLLSTHFLVLFVKMSFHLSFANKPAPQGAERWKESSILGGEKLMYSWLCLFLELNCTQYTRSRLDRTLSLAPCKSFLFEEIEHSKHWQQE